MNRSQKCSICLSIFGVVLIILCVALASVIYSKLSSGIADKVTLKNPSQDLSAYNKWSDPTDSSNPARYWNVYFFNLTNPDDFALKNSEPIFQEVGPYVYREYSYKYNISFSSDNSQVTYSEQTNYTFVPEQSGAGLSDTDQITGLWSTYALLAMSAGGYTQFELGAQSLFLQFALVPYIRLLQAASPVVYNGTAANLEAAGQWGNLKGNAAIGVPANISFVNSPAVAFFPAGVKNLYLGLANNFKVFPEFAAYASQYPGNTIPTPNAAALLFGGSPLFPCPLLTTQAGTGIPCTLFFQNLVQTNITLAQQYYPLTVSQLNLLSNYLKSGASALLNALAFSAGAKNLALKMYVTRNPSQWLFYYADPFLILRNDPIPNGAYFPQNFSTPDDAYVADRFPTTLYTGQSDVNLASTYIKWENQTVLPSRNGSISNQGFWCNIDETVEGHSDYQFTPGSSSSGGFSFTNGVSSSSILEVWVPIIYRQLNFQFDSNINVKGIDALRFRIDDDEFKVNISYSSYVPGLINLTCPKGGRPIMLTQPHYLQVQADPSLLCNLTAPDPTIHDTCLDVDPITGATIRGYQRLQLNILTSPNIVRNRSTLYPALWIEKTTTLTDQQASDYKNQIYYAFDLRRDLVIVFAVFGSLFFVGGLAWFAYASKSSKETYDTDYQNLGN